MGGVLERKDGDRRPLLCQCAARSRYRSSPGEPLERVQIIKGWVDEDGSTHERVVDILGNETQGLGVDMNRRCAAAPGHASLCTVWEDPMYRPGESAFYYARLRNTQLPVEHTPMPSGGVNPFRKVAQLKLMPLMCSRMKMATRAIFTVSAVPTETDPFYSPTIRERAWTSPIWLSTTR